MGSFLEAAVAISLQALVMASITSSLIATLATSRLASDVASQMLHTRQLEQLLDTTIAPLGRRSRGRRGVALASPWRVVIEADLDGNGHIDVRSRERSAFEIAVSPARIVHRIGRQAMTVSELPGHSLRFAYYDRHGQPTTDPAAVSLIAMPTAGATLYAAIDHPWP